MEGDLLQKKPDMMGTSVSRALEASPENGFVAGCAQTIQSLNATIGEIAGTDIPVLLQGDSGTGKEVYARLVHRLSAQNSLQLTKLSCTMLESGQLLTSVSKLMESGDVASQELGTLFLDGVDELNVDCQRVLLSILQKEETVTGKRKGLRLISTATRSLEREIELGRFRRELYFRIAGVCLHLPRLRDRKEDIPALMEFLLEKHAGEMGRKAPNLQDDEMELLLKYGWPGNIRELGNLAKKIAALGDARATIAEMRGTPTMRDRLMEMPPNTSLKVAAKTASRLAERDLILKALDRTHWNRKQAARELQISYKALLYKIKQMNVPGEQLEKQQGEE